MKQSKKREPVSYSDSLSATDFQLATLVACGLYAHFG